jgi:hypothetical protein
MLAMVVRSWGSRAATGVTVAVVAATLGAVPARSASAPTGLPIVTATDRPDGPVPLERAGRGLRSAEVRVGDGTTVRTATPFAMAGVTWRGPLSGDGAVRIRTASSSGSWSSWRPVEVLADVPDRGRSPDRARTGEGGATGRPVTGTDLVWVGEAIGIQVDVPDPAPDDLTVVLLDPVGTPVAPSSSSSGARSRRVSPLKPRLRSRADWGAEPSWRSGKPSYNRTVQQVHVHHTVNSNDYGKADVPGLLRGIYRYHTHDLGWSDIGYNFLVDRFGRTWIGRAGGARRPVQGAHTLGFNSTSTGVAVIGNFEDRDPGRRVIGAIARLAGWKLHRYDRRPRGWVKVWSHGSDRFGRGRVVTLRTIDGHRDTNETACPGERLYDRLPDVRRRAALWIQRHT